jgi:DNA-binding GntR family transcriptional regulator
MLRSEEEPSDRLAHAAYRRIEDMIFSGVLKGGQILAERRLAEELQVSLTPLREALLMLEGEGLVSRRGSRYLQVHQLTELEYIQILNIRRLLEPEAARLAAGRIGVAELKALAARLEALMGAAAGTGNAPEGEPRMVDDELHSMVAAAADSPLMAQIIGDLRRRTRIFDLNRMPERFQDACREHLALVHALMTGDGDKAAQAMMQHLDAVKASIVRRIQAL